MNPAVFLGELSGDPSRLANELAVWLDSFAAQGIDSVATGVIVLRRRHGTNWFRVDEMPYGPIGSGSDHRGSSDDEHTDELLAAVKDLYGAGFLVRHAAPSAEV